MGSTYGADCACLCTTATSEYGGFYPMHAVRNHYNDCAHFNCRLHCHRATILYSRSSSYCNHYNYARTAFHLSHSLKPGCSGKVPVEAVLRWPFQTQGTDGSLFPSSVPCAGSAIPNAQIVIPGSLIHKPSLVGTPARFPQSLNDIRRRRLAALPLPSFLSLVS